MWKEGGGTLKLICDKLIAFAAQRTLAVILHQHSCTQNPPLPLGCLSHNASWYQLKEEEGRMRAAFSAEGRVLSPSLPLRIMRPGEGKAEENVDRCVQKACGVDASNITQRAGGHSEDGGGIKRLFWSG